MWGVQLPFVLLPFCTYIFNSCSGRSLLPSTDPLCCPECTAKLLGSAEKNSLSSAVRITHCLTFNYTPPCWISMCLGKTFKVVSLSFQSLICKTRRILLVFPAGILNGLISWGLQSVHRVASWLNLCSAWSSFFFGFPFSSWNKHNMPGFPLLDLKNMADNCELALFFAWTIL